MRAHRIPSLLTALLLCTVAIGSARAQGSVNIPGDFQSELGCPGDWQPDCEATHLAQDPEDGVWRGTFNVPAGSWQYKAAIDDSWAENYGLNAQPGGANIPLTLAADTDVTFYYSHETHWITDNVNSKIVTLVGDFQSELGCAGDWDPACLRTWLQDPYGFGFYWLITYRLPAGDYECKVTIGESWAENYGAGGVPNGPNVQFSVPFDCAMMLFAFDPDDNTIHVIPMGETIQPTSVTIPGNLQSELGCAGDWDPACAATHLAFDANDEVWQGTFNVPAGNWEYKAAIDDSWDENYGLHGWPNGPNIPLSLGDPEEVKFYYHHGSHWITDNVNSKIVTVPGSFQSELGCSGDWDPSCLRSWLQDPDGDGVHWLRITTLPAGTYECKVAINESWDENYGAGGVPGGPNIAFTVPEPCTEILLFYDENTHVLEVVGGAPGNRPPDCSAAAASVTELWPPNHQMVPVEILGVTDPDGDPVTITVTGVTQDEPVNGKGDGSTCPDAVLENGALSLRAERAGGGNGRIYVVSFTAEDGNGGMCSGTVSVCVPHDQGEPDMIAGRGAPVLASRGCLDDGDPQDHDALAACPLKGRKAKPEGVAATWPLEIEGGIVRGNPATVAYTLPQDAEVQLAVYDISGRRVATVESGPRSAGAHRASWDAGPLSPGVYFYRLRAGKDVVSRSVLVLR